MHPQSRVALIYYVCVCSWLRGGLNWLVTVKKGPKLKKNGHDLMIVPTNKAAPRGWNCRSAQWGLIWSSVTVSYSRIRFISDFARLTHLRLVFEIILIELNIGIFPFFPTKPDFDDFFVWLFWMWFFGCVANLLCFSSNVQPSIYITRGGGRTGSNGRWSKEDAILYNDLIGKSSKGKWCNWITI